MIFNRELSWLSFNRRVLEEAQDKDNPLMERLKFLAITSSNLDEFYMVRVSGLLHQLEAEHQVMSGMSPSDCLTAISDEVRKMITGQYNCLNRGILPALSDKIQIVSMNELSEIEREQADLFFRHTLFPILTPMAIDSSRPFPFLANRSLSILVELNGEEDGLLAVVGVPTSGSVRRFFEVGKGSLRRFVMVEDIIKAHMDSLFVGYTVKGAYDFRITRDGDLDIDESDAEDLLSEIQDSIKRRKWGAPVRLEASRKMPGRFVRFLMEELEVSDREVFFVPGIMDLTWLFSFYSHISDQSHKYAQQIPQICPEFFKTNPFEVITEGDVLVHHPYQTFDAVLDFVQNAAKDPQVLAIKQTLYRVSGNSPIVAALMEAAERGKQVSVLVELRARFDEENNIQWAKRLEQAGVHVVYGLVGLKTHCKVCLVVRREEDGIKRYVHLGTGNYNDQTAKIYTDYGLFTARESFGADASQLFNLLTGYSKQMEFQRLFVAPVSLRNSLLTLIDEQRALGANGKIVAKMNSLVDEALILALYRASLAGVKITLLVRGICCLIPGVKELSENIAVYSIVGRYLEHSRVFIFGDGDETRVFLASADWMPRNMDRRVEVCFPVLDRDICERILEDMDISLTDTQKRRELLPDGQWVRVDRRKKDKCHSQQLFFDMAKKLAQKATSPSIEERFTPIN